MKDEGIEVMWIMKDGEERGVCLSGCVVWVGKRVCVGGGKRVCLGMGVW